MSDKTIKVSELYQSSSLITRDAARDLFNVISHLPETYIKLDFSNVQYASRSFFDELNKLLKDHPTFKIIHCLTEEKTKHPLVKEYTRINEKILKKYIIKN